ncbi:MAG TPA: magnesium transporter CorA family protein [Anaerolineaceae bacterium]|nr:magnesium transporter CorA family protein [Anaerolineaceae bacterium]HQH84651.1 magnesium transporter CorA family protein [Anaerolineaceae bacterium]
MLTIYRSTETGLATLSDIIPGCWISAIEPTTDEIEQIHHLGIPRDFLTYPLDLDERPRTEREDDGSMLIILRVPYYEGPKVDVPYTTVPLGIIITEKYIVTVCRRPNEAIQELTSGRIRGLSTVKRNRFILRMLLLTASRYLENLRQINRTVEALEDQCQGSIRNREMLELLKYQKSLVYFTTALKGNQLMMERLQRSQLFHMYPDDEDLLEDVITENQQALEMVNISSSILTSMMDAFASLISNNLNEVMKFLASITIILSIPTIVTSFFGMNIPLPWENNGLAPVYIFGVFLLLSIGVVLLFRRRDWL